MSEDWYYVRDGQRVGPVSAGELKRLADVGELAPASMVSRKGLGKWVTAVSVKGLCDETADSLDKVIFTQGDVTLTTSTLVIGPNQFDVRNVRAVNVSPVIEGSPHGAAAAFCMACVCFLYVSVSGAIYFVLALSMGKWVVMWGSLTIVLAGYATGRLLLRPARNLWTPKNGDYHLNVMTSGGNSTCLASDDAQSLKSLAAKINEGLGCPGEPVLRTPEPRWIRFIRTRIPFLFRA